MFKEKENIFLFKCIHRISKVSFPLFYNERPFISKRNVLFTGTCQPCSYVVTEIAIHQEWRLLLCKTKTYLFKYIEYGFVSSANIYTQIISFWFDFEINTLGFKTTNIFYMYMKFKKKQTEKVNLNIIFQSIHFKNCKGTVHLYMEFHFESKAELLIPGSWQRATNIVFSARSENLYKTLLRVIEGI